MFFSLRKKFRQGPEKKKSESRLRKKICGGRVRGKKKAIVVLHTKQAMGVEGRLSFIQNKREARRGWLTLHTKQAMGGGVVDPSRNKRWAAIIQNKREVVCNKKHKKGGGQKRQTSPSQKKPTRLTRKKFHQDNFFSPNQKQIQHAQGTSR